MTANGMRAMFLLGYEGARLANRTFNDREISDFLSKAELEFVKQRFDKFKNRTQRGLGDGPIRASELSGLVSSTEKIYKRYEINGVTYNDNAVGNPFMAGNNNNGAMRRPDLDNNLNSDGEEPEANFGVFVALPDEAMYILSERVDLYKDGCRRNNIKVLEVTYVYYDKGINDPYANPDYDLVWSMDWGSYTTDSLGDGTNTSSKSYSTTGSGTNMIGQSTIYYNGSTNTTTPVTINSIRARHLIPGKGFDIIGYNIHYIVKPKGVTVDVQSPSSQINSILPSHVHQEIVDMAVKLASASIVPEQGKYQVNQLESKEDE